MTLSNEELREAIEQTASRLCQPLLMGKPMPEKATDALTSHLENLQREELRRATASVTASSPKE